MRNPGSCKRLVMPLMTVPIFELMANHGNLMSLFRYEGHRNGFDQKMLQIYLHQIEIGHNLNFQLNTLQNTPHFQIPILKIPSGLVLNKLLPWMTLETPIEQSQDPKKSIFGLWSPMSNPLITNCENLPSTTQKYKNINLVSNLYFGAWWQ